MYYRCRVCGSKDIEIPMWVNMNTNIPNGDYGSDGDTDCWCKDCEDHTNYEEVDE